MIMIGCTPGGTTSNLFSYFRSAQLNLRLSTSNDTHGGVSLTIGDRNLHPRHNHHPNAYPDLSNGDVSLSIGMTVLSNIAAFVMMPLLIVGYGQR